MMWVHEIDSELDWGRAVFLVFFPSFFLVKTLHLQCLDWRKPSYCLLSLKGFLFTKFCTISFTGKIGLDYLFFIYLFYSLGNICWNIKLNIWMSRIVENLKFLLLSIVELLQFVQSELDVKKSKVYLVLTRFPKEVFRAAILTLVILICNWICFCKEK